MLFRKLTIIACLVLASVACQEVQAACSNPKEAFNLEIFGTYTKNLGKNNFEANFTLIELKKTKLSHQITFRDEKYKTVVIKVNHLPSTNGLAKGNQYTLKYVAGIGMGIGGLKTVTLLDKKGVVFSINSLPQNTHLGVASSIKEFSACPPYGGFRPALTTLKTTQGKTIANAKSGQTVTVYLNGKAFTLKMITSSVRQTMKGVSVDGPERIAAYVLTRK